MAYYNGWKHHHGTKFLSLEMTFGICMYMYGPRSFRESDLDLLELSHVVDILRNCQQHLPPQLHKVMYGDGIFPIMDYLISKHLGDDLTHQEVLENKGMCRIRIGNEWVYGVTANLFPYVKFKNVTKLLKHEHISQYYIVATLFRNFFAFYRDNLVSGYFNADIDASVRIDDYLDPIWRVN